MRVALVLLTVFASLPVLAAGAGPVAPADALSVPRAAHSATLLPSGSVLVAGGCVAGGCELDDRSATAELYDPSTGTIGPTGRMAANAWGASLLANGQVLVAGGFDPDGVTASAELFDPGRGVFGSTGSLRIARGGFTMTPLRSGAVLVAGGASGASVRSTVELYDPSPARSAQRGGWPFRGTPTPRRSCGTGGCSSRADRTGAGESSGASSSTTPGAVAGAAWEPCASRGTSTAPRLCATASYSSSAARARGTSPVASPPPRSSTPPWRRSRPAAASAWSSPIQAREAGRRSVSSARALRSRRPRCSRAATSSSRVGYDETIAPTRRAWVIRTR